MKKKLCSMLLCAALFLAVGGPAAGAESAPGPSVTVEVNQVKDGDTVEVRLIVENAADIQSVHAVLTYDPAKLTLTQWNGTKIEPGAVPTAGNTIAPGNVAGKPSLVYQEDGSGWAYLYFGAAGQQTTIDPDTQVVTVQFRYGAGGTADDLKANLASYLKLAETVPKQFAMITAPAVLNAGKVQYASDSADKKLDTVFTLENRKSLYSGAGSAVTGDYAITFFDWDGSVVDVTAAGANATEQAAQAQQKLTIKKGYEFDHWLLVKQGAAGLTTEGGTFTSNATPLNEDNPDIAKLTVVDKNLLVQAAYKATSELNGGLEDGTKVHYTVVPTSYTRYGDAMPADGKYSITLTVRRENKAGSGVTRARTPGVIVKMTPTAGGQAIYTLLTLSNTDETTCEVVPNKQIAAVEYYFIDVSTSPTNWPGAGNLSPLNVSISKDGKDGFQCLGTVGFINQLVLTQTVDPEAWTTAMNPQTFQDAMLTYKDIAKARDALYAAIKTAGKPLTQADMQAAIGSN